MGKYDKVLDAAVACDICEPWAKMIDAAKSVDDLMEMYVKGIDFCLSNPFPTNDMLLEMVGPVKLKSYGVYIDQEVSVHNDPFIVLLGKCSGTIHIDEYTASQVYVKHKSQLNITAKDNSFIVIDAFESSNISVNASGNCKVLINLYGDASQSHTIVGSAFVKVVHKNKASY